MDEAAQFGEVPHQFGTVGGPRWSAALQRPQTKGLPPAAAEPVTHAAWMGSALARRMRYDAANTSSNVQ